MASSQSEGSVLRTAVSDVNRICISADDMVKVLACTSGESNFQPADVRIPQPPNRSRVGRRAPCGRIPHQQNFDRSPPKPSNSARSHLQGRPTTQEFPGLSTLPAWTSGIAGRVAGGSAPPLVSSGEASSCIHGPGLQYGTLFLASGTASMGSSSFSETAIYVRWATLRGSSETGPGCEMDMVASVIAAAGLDIYTQAPPEKDHNR